MALAPQALARRLALDPASVLMNAIVVLAHVRDIEEWLQQGWYAACSPWHPVSRHYGRVYMWRPL